jgi:hypothetical protein
MSANHPFDEELSRELKAVEAVLRRLTPSADPLNRDRLMYLSGRASVASRQNAMRFAWPISTAALLLVSLTFGAMLLNSSSGRRQVGPVDNGQAGQNSIAIKSVPGVDRGVDLAVADQQPSSYFQLRNAVLAGGVEALPSPRSDVRINNSLETIPSMPLKLKYLGG